MEFPFLLACFFFFLFWPKISPTSSSRDLFTSSAISVFFLHKLRIPLHDLNVVSTKLFSTHYLINSDSIELFQFLIDYLHEWRQHFPVLRFWLGPFPIFLLYTPEGTEVKYEKFLFFFYFFLSLVIVKSINRTNNMSLGI